MDKIKFIIPSYQRPTRQVTLDNLISLGYKKDEIYIYVQEEKDEYEYMLNWNDFAHIIYKPAWNIGSARNNCLSDLEIGEQAIMLDDDVRHFKYLENARLHKFVSREQLDKVIHKGFEESNKYNAKLWGFNTYSTPMFMCNRWDRELHNMIYVWFGITYSGINVDVKQQVFDDDDYVIRHLFEGSKVLRYNRYCVNHTMASVGTEMARQRNNQKYFDEQLDYMKQKYGDFIYLYEHKTHKRKYPKLQKDFVKQGLIKDTRIEQYNEHLHTDL